MTPLLPHTATWLLLAAVATIAQPLPPTRSVPPASAHAVRGVSFEDVTARAGLADFRHVAGSSDKAYILEALGSGVAMLDLDGDGLLDIYLVNGGTLDPECGRIASTRPAALYLNRGDGTFVDIARDAGVTNDRWGQGVCAGDYDNDGNVDLFVANFGTSRLYRATSARRYVDVASAAGVAVEGGASGCAFGDYDNDGWRDLLVVDGHVYPQADHLPWNSSYRQRALLYRNLQGRRFEEVGAAAGPALTQAHAARGSAVGDYDNDGAVDILIGVIDGAPVLARNAGGAAAGHWLSVRLVGDPAQRSPRDGIGSTVTAVVGGRRLYGDVASGRGQVSQSDTRVHFGLGAATAVQSLIVDGPAETPAPTPSTASMPSSRSIRQPER